MDSKHSLRYLVVLSESYTGSCQQGEITLQKTDPTGSTTNVCIKGNLDQGALDELNIELNSVINLGYKLVETSYTMNGNGHGGGLIDINGSDHLNPGTSFIFAIPWSASGLEEVPTTLKSFFISLNPANTFVDVSLDYSLKGESEVVFISEAGYISHKESIDNISKNEKYNIDIFKIPAGKYLVTIVNGKTYTTPQKLIIF